MRLIMKKSKTSQIFIELCDLKSVNITVQKQIKI